MEDIWLSVLVTHQNQVTSKTPSILGTTCTVQHPAQAKPKTLMESALKRDGSFAWSHLTFHSNRKILTVLVVQQQHNQPVDILVFSEVPIGVELQQQNLKSWILIVFEHIYKWLVPDLDLILERFGGRPIPVSDNSNNGLM